MDNVSSILTKAQTVFLDALFPGRCPVCGGIVPPDMSRSEAAEAVEAAETAYSWAGSEAKPRIPHVSSQPAAPYGSDRLICPACTKRLSFVQSPVCKKCGKEVFSETQEYCFDCTRHRRSFEYGAALLNYNEAAGVSMAAVKYKNKREYLEYYALKALEQLGEILERMDADALVPVPVHPARYRQRGFNQAQLLAEGLSRGLGLPCLPELLMRTKKTEPQKSLDPSGRLKNLKKAFVAGEVPEDIKSVILIDDIYTTGSTIEACSRALLGAGVKKVYFFTLCIGQGQ